MDKNLEHQNQRFWDEIASVHLKSYDLRELREKGILIDKIQLKEIGEVKNKKMLHLQCHIGTDTLSWEHFGAEMTGVDFSEESIKIARELAKELDCKAHFIHSNIFDLPSTHKEKYDIVYTSQGVLAWIRDIKEWAKVIRNYLKDSGFFYMMEIHPVSSIFNDEKSGIPEVYYSYFTHGKAQSFSAGGNDYSNFDYTAKNGTYQWTWTLSDIVNALINAGMRIEFLNEYNKAFYKAMFDMVQRDDGWWYWPGYEDIIPLIFTLKAVLV